MLTGLSVYLPESLLTVFDNLEFLIRIVLAAILGAMVGLERTKQQKDAGIRTHCIVALTSAVFMILSKYAFIDVVALAGSKGADPSRIASQVVTGISFLGAGVIFKNANFAIKGLTTAAGMWATSAIGMAIGAGAVLGRPCGNGRSDVRAACVAPLPYRGATPSARRSCPSACATGRSCSTRSRG